MTNRELMKANPESLTELERQKRLLLSLDSEQKPCPICRLPCSVFEATGIDLDQWDYASQTRVVYQCPGCKAVLCHSISEMLGSDLWFWTLDRGYLQQLQQDAERWHNIRSKLNELCAGIHVIELQRGIIADMKAALLTLDPGVLQIVSQRLHQIMAPGYQPGPWRNEPLPETSGDQPTP